jgi:hypothetical protein
MDHYYYVPLTLRLALLPAYLHGNGSAVLLTRIMAANGFIGTMVQKNKGKRRRPRRHSTAQRAAQRSRQQHRQQALRHDQRLGCRPECGVSLPGRLFVFAQTGRGSGRQGLAVPLWLLEKWR